MKTQSTLGSHYDVIVVGAGPAGLSAALILGRCRRQVLVCDTGAPRNAASHVLHGFLTRDGIAPAELLRIGREQLGPYENVELRDVAVTDVCHGGDHFEVTLADGPPSPSTRRSSRRASADRAASRSNLRGIGLPKALGAPGDLSQYVHRICPLAVLRARPPAAGANIAHALPTSCKQRCVGRGDFRGAARGVGAPAVRRRR